MAQAGWKSSSNFAELAKPSIIRPTKKPKATDILNKTAMEVRALGRNREKWEREEERERAQRSYD